MKIMKKQQIAIQSNLKLVFFFFNLKAVKKIPEKISMFSLPSILYYYIFSYAEYLLRKG